MATTTLQFSADVCPQSGMAFIRAKKMTRLGFLEAPYKDVIAIRDGYAHRSRHTVMSFGFTYGERFGLSMLYTSISSGWTFAQLASMEDQAWHSRRDI